MAEHAILALKSISEGTATLHRHVLSEYPISFNTGLTAILAYVVLMSLVPMFVLGISCARVRVGD